MLFLTLENAITLASTFHTSQISYQPSTLQSNFSQVQSSVSPSITYTTPLHSLLLSGNSPASSNYGILSTLEVMVESVFYEIIVVGLQLQFRRELGLMATLGWSFEAFLSIGSHTIPPGRPWTR